MKLITISKLRDMDDLLTIQINDANGKSKSVFHCSLSSLNDIVINNL